VAAVVGLVNAASAELVALIAEVLETEAWEGAGIRSPEHWVQLHCGVSGGRAAGLVRAARGLAGLPSARGAFQRGELSEDQVRVLAARVPPRFEEQALEIARHATVGQLQRFVRALPLPPRLAPAGPDAGPDADPDAGPDADPDADPVEPAGLSGGPEPVVAFGFDDDGWWWCRGLLPPEQGAVVEKALVEARNQVFARRHPKAGDDPARPDRADVSWPDALLAMSEAALGVLSDPGGAAPGGRPGDRFQVLVHVRADEPASSYLHLGPPLPEPVRREITCDAPMRWVLERDGRLVALSAKQDTVDRKTRALVEDRDGGCVVPGCAQRRWLYVHHIVHREDGGPTELANLCCLCPDHHRQHHRGRLHVRGDPTRPGGLTITGPDGRAIGPFPARPPGERPDRAARRLGVEPGNYHHPTGERFDPRWFNWNVTGADPPGRPASASGPPAGTTPPSAPRPPPSRPAPP
jgi:hypothetical protein